MKLSFICPGASKCGTTTLHDMLRQHPDVTLTTQKETQFFVKKSLWEKGIGFYFQNYFEQPNPKSLIGEICPQYMSSNGVAKRIHSCFGGGLKIIMMLRHPVDRAYSHYLMKTRSFENLSFAQAMRDAIAIEKSTDEYKRGILKRHLNFEFVANIYNSKSEMDAYRYTRYIYPGLYAEILKDYLSFFPMENIHIVIFEQFVKNPQWEMERIHEFLNIDVGFQHETVHSNERRIYKSPLIKRLRNLTHLIPVGVKQRLTNGIGQERYGKLKTIIEKPFIDSTRSRIDADFARELYQFYLPDIEELKSMIPNDLSLWKVY